MNYWAYGMILAMEIEEKVFVVTSSHMDFLNTALAQMDGVEGLLEVSDGVSALIGEFRDFIGQEDGASGEVALTWDWIGRLFAYQGVELSAGKNSVFEALSNTYGNNWGVAHVRTAVIDIGGSRDSVFDLLKQGKWGEDRAKDQLVSYLDDMTEENLLGLWQTTSFLEFLYESVKGSPNYEHVVGRSLDLCRQLKLDFELMLASEANEKNGQGRLRQLVGDEKVDGVLERWRKVEEMFTTGAVEI